MSDLSARGGNNKKLNYFCLNSSLSSVKVVPPLLVTYYLTVSGAAHQLLINQASYKGSRQDRKKKGKQSMESYQK